MNPFEAIAKELNSVSVTCGAIRVIGIDGPAGSGKSTFAGHLAVKLNQSPIVHMDDLYESQIIHMDDLYEGWNEPLNSKLFNRMIEQIFLPLSSGRVASYQKFDWHKGIFDQVVEVSPPNFLIIEGVGALHPEIQQYITVGIWLESNPKGRMKRVLDRDGEDLKSHMIDWQKMEQAYFAKHKIADRADFALRTD